VKKNFQKNWRELIILALVVALAIFLRFYKISELHFFTYDQSRDALYIKRMIVEHKWRLLGTQTSYPGVYCPPFYYYSAMPFLWLFGLNPVGLDVYTAFFGVLTVVLIWYVADKFFGKPAGILIAPIYATMPLIVELSRRAWNLNTLPFFALLTIYFLWRVWQSWQFKDLVIASALFGYTISLHMGAPVVVPVLLVSWLRYWQKTKKAKPVIFAFLVFFFFLSPVVIFDFRHQHLLTKDFIRFFFYEKRVGVSKESFLGPVFTSFFTIFSVLFSGNFSKMTGGPLDFSGKIGNLKDFFTKPMPISVVAHKPLSFEYQWWGPVLMILTSVVSIFWWKKNRETKKSLKPNISLGLIWSWILIGVFLSRFYQGKFYFFYYTFLFPMPFLLLSLTLRHGWTKRFLRPLIATAAVLIVGYNLSRIKTFETPQRTIKDLVLVAQTISQDNPPDLDFNLATNQVDPDRWDHNAVDYRYFVEAYFGQKPLDWLPEDYQKAQVLYLIDEDSIENPIKSPIMEIATFGPKSVSQEWKLVNGVTIYRLEKQ